MNCDQSISASWTVANGQFIHKKATRRIWLAVIHYIDWSMVVSCSIACDFILLMASAHHIASAINFPRMMSRWQSLLTSFTSRLFTTDGRTADGQRRPVAWKSIWWTKTRNWRTIRFGDKNDTIIIWKVTLFHPPTDQPTSSLVLKSKDTKR